MADELANSFQHPPASARPWVYWFPLSGNLTKPGITADLEAMARVGQTYTQCRLQLPGVRSVFWVSR